MMTCSEEKTAMLKVEFMRRVVKSGKKLEELSGNERQALANEIQQEIDAKLIGMEKKQESKFKMSQEAELMKEKKREALTTPSDGSKNDLLTRFRALKTQQILEDNTKDQEGTPCHQEPKTMPSSFHHKEEGNSKELLRKVVTTTEVPMRWEPSRNKERLVGEGALFSRSRSYSPSRGLGGRLFSESVWSNGMTRVEHSAHHPARPNDSAVGMAKAFSSMATKSSSDSKFVLIDDYNIEDEDDNESQKTSQEELNNSNIEQIIELKLVVANQQATMDTLSSKLHNFELANRQLRHELRRVDQSNKSSVKKVEAENRKLADQLGDCREREISLMQELNHRGRGGRDNDDPVMRENAHLRYQLELMGGPIIAAAAATTTVGQKYKTRYSLATTVTNVSSDLDSLPNTL